MTGNKHTVCRKGAAVRLHGYAPAVVLSVDRDGQTGTIWATCRITGRGSDRKAGRVPGPHGYRTGEIVTVWVHDAPPRDRVFRRGGRIGWRSFDVELTTP